MGFLLFGAGQETTTHPDCRRRFTLLSHEDQIGRFRSVRADANLLRVLARLALQIRQRRSATAMAICTGSRSGEVICSPRTGGGKLRSRQV